MRRTSERARPVGREKGVKERSVSVALGSGYGAKRSTERRE